jgi:hypothetical protein
MHMLAEGHETPRRKALMFSVPGLGTADQLLPFQASMRVSPMFPGEAVPTAMHDVPDAHETL